MFVRKQDVISLKRNEINCILDQYQSDRNISSKSVVLAVSGEIACTKNGRRK